MEMEKLNQRLLVVDDKYPSAPLFLKICQKGGYDVFEQAFRAMQRCQL